MAGGPTNLNPAATTDRTLLSLERKLIDLQRFSQLDVFLSQALLGS
jgi:hypothetical protein